MDPIIARLVQIQQSTGNALGGVFGALVGVLIAGSSWIRDAQRIFSQRFEALIARVDKLELATTSSSSTSSSSEGAWAYQDLTSPIFAVTVAVANVFGVQSTTHGALAVQSQLTGKDHYDVECVAVQNVPGQTLPTDASVKMDFLSNYSNSALTWTVTPRWIQTATAVNAVIAVTVAGIYRATIRTRQRAGIAAA